ncbi:hypothetical protein ENTCAN_05907 [Enterobacter cancerogenus ATCC 35316]|nr:hypothetical protein ENTCAN_05907 [Enterobacter cancerogenus ATCC 35316]
MLCNASERISNQLMFSHRIYFAFTFQLYRSKFRHSIRKIVKFL